MINTFKIQDQDKIIALWNTVAVKIGYKELDHTSFHEIFTGNPYFNENHTFVMHEDNRVVGFVCGCTGDDLPLGKTSGYLTSVLLEEAYEASENYKILLDALEKSFADEGKTQSEVLFFNPMMLPWYIKGTNRHEHNNAPGVFRNSKLHEELYKNGYQDRAIECAMYLKLEGFTIPEAILAKEEKAAVEGYEVTLFDQNRHYGVKEMLQKLDNPLWEREISQCTRTGVPVLVAVHNDKVVGFAGPMIRQKSGRGYFTGIGVVKEHEGHGLGTVLFFKLCEEEKKVGAEYMSLYTGIDNPAGKIYHQAGFETVQEFVVMRKICKPISMKRHDG
ncbi:MAG TPA: GNAT family N-acetyltransferase [Lachnoclostridium phytofermentans]|uniref:GNAT family N-acetyltransferase n=1 Tax=Lachnoclostridium phytofermentans TaxID=66219 RepID=A0A3D2XDN3_9FIRM|nr:GNAT family N-acetyltransferase [Lachnoclostridium sp.]HCL04438.1 GNAT family N-acetyltransferase [Lachnoclostridium phytofermentans]